MPIDLEKLSPRELQELIASAQKQIANSVKKQIAQVRNKIQLILREEGLSLEDVYGSKRGAKANVAAAKVPSVPKYANPKDPSQTWSGRGKRPQWFVEALARGKTERSLLIDKTTASTPNRAVKQAPPAANPNGRPARAAKPVKKQ